jgi:hypothetical protein
MIYFQTVVDKILKFNAAFQVVVTDALKVVTLPGDDGPNREDRDHGVGYS